MFYENETRSLLFQHEQWEGAIRKKVRGALASRRNVCVIVMNPKFPAAGSVPSLGVA